MKKIYNYTFQLVCVYILILSCFSIFNFEIEKDNYSNSVHNINSEKKLESTFLVQNNEESFVTIEEEKESINQVKDNNDFTIQEENKVENVETNVKVEETVNIVDTSNFEILSQEIINLSHYGHDCYGCTTGYTASGYYVGDGRIYYQDPTFGSVRVVAADSKYPIGTIVRIEYHGSDITAIVLDRGGGIGDGKKFQIDLLTSSNNEAYQLGVVENTSLEVLRLGY